MRYLTGGMFRDVLRSFCCWFCVVVEEERLCKVQGYVLKVDDSSELALLEVEFMLAKIEYYID